MEENEANVETIPSNNAPVSLYLKILYLTLPIWGIITFYLFWNGSHGYLDRGYWNQLQKASNTTQPPINYIQFEEKK